MLQVRSGARECLLKDNYAQDEGYTICPNILPNLALFVLNWAIVLRISDSMIKPTPKMVWMSGSYHADRSLPKKKRMLEKLKPIIEISASTRMNGCLAFILLFSFLPISMSKIC